MRRWGAVVCLAMVALAGCADRTSVQDHEDNLCNKIAVMDGTITQLAALTEKATVQQVKDLKAKIDAEYKDVQTAAKKVSSFGIDQITKAYNDVSASVAGVNNQAAVAAAIPKIGVAAGEFADARLQLNTSAGC